MMGTNRPLLSRAEISYLFLPQEQVDLRCARNATFFRHFLAHLPYILANESRGLTKKRGGERKRGSFRYHATLCERTDSPKALGSVASYLEISLFIPINDSEQS